MLSIHDYEHLLQNKNYIKMKPTLKSTFEQKIINLQNHKDRYNLLMGYIHKITLIINKQTFVKITTAR